MKILLSTLTVLISIFVITTFLLVLPKSTFAASCFTSGNKTVTGSGVGTYYVSADNWNGGNACVSTDGKTDFTIQSQTASGSSVLAYPNINAGCGAIHGIGCTPNWVTKKISALGTPTETWTIAGSTNSSAEYDVADDIWIAPATTGCPAAEVMIFINGQNLAAPSSTKVTINGVSYYYKEYKTTSNSCTWNYVQFRRVNSVTSVTNLQLMPFFTYAESKGLITSSDYLRQVSAGFELWSYGAGLKTTNFSLTE